VREQVRVLLPRVEQVLAIVAGNPMPDFIDPRSIARRR